MKDKETWLMMLFLVVLYGSTYWNKNPMKIGRLAPVESKNSNLFLMLK